MIVDTLDQASNYLRLSPLIAEASHFLRTNDLEALPVGQVHLEGNEEFALVLSYTTQTAAERQWEAHRKYIDLQYIVHGVEWIGYAPLASLTVTQPYDPVRDIMLLDGAGSFMRVSAGMFVILGPQDAHKPGVYMETPEQVKKIVFKLDVGSWRKIP